MTDDDGAIRHRLGRMLRDRRILLGISQETCAARCDVRQPAISLWERGGSFPSIPNLVVLTRILGIAIGDLDRIIDAETNGEGEAA